MPTPESKGVPLTPLAPISVNPTAPAVPNPALVGLNQDDPAASQALVDANQAARGVVGIGGVEVNRFALIGGGIALAAVLVAVIMQMRARPKAGPLARLLGR